MVGAGLGGISAALWLAAEGYDVEVVEKNDHVGGKLNLLEEKGEPFPRLPPRLVAVANDHPTHPSVLWCRLQFAQWADRAGKMPAPQLSAPLQRGGRAGP